MSRILLILLLAISLNAFSQSKKDNTQKDKYIQLALDAYGIQDYSAAFKYFENAISFSKSLEQDSLIVFNCAVAADKANMYEKAK